MLPSRTHSRSVPPLLLLGTLLLTSTASPTDLRGEDVFMLQDRFGFAGQTVSIPLLAEHDELLRGFSIAVSHDPVPLDITGISFAGTSVENLLSGTAPEYVGLEVDDAAGTMTLGVIFGFSAVSPLNSLPALPATTGNPDHLVSITAAIAPGVLPGDVELTLASSIGDPGVSSVYSDGTITHVPALESATITVTNPIRYSFTPASTVPGGTAQTFLVVDHPGDALAAIQFAITYDTTTLTLREPLSTNGYLAGTDVTTLLAPDGIDYLVIATASDPVVPGVGFFSISAVFDFDGSGGQILPMGSDRTAFRLTFDVAPDPALDGQSLPLIFTDTISPEPEPMVVGPLPPVTNVVSTADGVGIPPLLIDGAIEVIDAPGFIRGDANNDGGIDVADAIFSLAFLFSFGAAPPCPDAADPNDDGSIDISDAIYALTFLFNDGAPPRHPHPGCGLDPTADGLSPCATPTTACP